MNAKKNVMPENTCNHRKIPALSCSVVIKARIFGICNKKLRYTKEHATLLAMPAMKICFEHIIAFPLNTCKKIVRKLIIGLLKKQLRCCLFRYPDFLGCCVPYHIFF